MEKLKKYIARDSFKTRERVFWFGVLIGFLLLITGLYSRYYVIAAVAIVIDALTVVYGRLAFRCPHCDVVIGMRNGTPNYCPQCGKPLEK